MTRLWRLSAAEYARAFDGGYGVANSGRWNGRGHPVTYCATVPSLCVLEKLVHVEDPSLLPDGLIMVEYDVPDRVGTDIVDLDDLPAGWQHDEDLTQTRGDEWLESVVGPLLQVPSVIVAMPGALDRNVVINHRHSAASRIRIVNEYPFELDPRLVRI